MLCIACAISPQQNLLSLIPWLLFEFYGFMSMIGSFILIYNQDETLILFDGDVLIIINIMNISALIFGLYLMYKFHRKQYWRFCHLLNTFLFCKLDERLHHHWNSAHQSPELQWNLIVTNANIATTDDTDNTSECKSEENGQINASENEIELESGNSIHIDLDMSLRELIHSEQQDQIIKCLAKIVAFQIKDNDNTYSGHDTQTNDESTVSCMDYTDNSTSYFSHIFNSSDDINLN